MAKSVAVLIGEQGMTVNQLTDRSGLEQSVVTAIATGCWTPSPEQRNKMAAALGVEVGDIAWGHKTPVQHIWGQGPG
jgi:ribosome-binding protein aMBF1 (putative translation factor)